MNRFIQHPWVSFWGIGVCLAVWLQLALLRIHILNWSQGLAQFVFCALLDVRVQIQQVLRKKVCVGGHIWLYSKRSSTCGIMAYFTPCVSFPWLPKFCANYTSKSLASPLYFSLAFSFTIPSPCAHFPCLKPSSQSRWMSSSPPPSSALYISLSDSSSSLLWQNFIRAVTLSSQSACNSISV